MQITKNHILSILVSLTYPIGVIIGNLIGYLLTKIMHFIYSFMAISLFEFIAKWGPNLVGGIVGGIVAGLFVIKLYKNIHFFCAMMAPLILTIILTGAVLLSLIILDQDMTEKIIIILGNILSFCFYMITVKDHYKLKA